MKRLLCVEANPIFRPVHRTRCRYVAMRGSAGSGKSTDTATMYILRLMSERGRNLLCVRKIEDSNRASTYAELCAAIRRIGVEDYWEASVSPLRLRCLTNNAQVLFRGMLDERQREKLKSITFQNGKLTDVWIEEATELCADDFEIIDDRLRGILPDGLFYQIKLTFNPVSAHHWIKRRFFDHRDKNVFCHHSTYLDNRFIDEGFRQRMERRKILDPDGYRVYGLGEWGLSGGAYFSEWRDAIHTSPPFTLPDKWRRYLTLDYGLDMLAAYWIALDPNGRAYVYRELYESGLIISEAAQRILKMCDEPLYQCFAPPDLWNRRQDTGRSAAEIFSECGLPLTKASNDRVAGWYDLKEWLRPFRDETGEMRSHLTVFTNCENLIRTLPSLTHDTRDVNDVSQTPHELTHAPDAIRYFVAGRPIAYRESEKTGRELYNMLVKKQNSAVY